MDKILIKDLHCRGVIGINDQERAEPQDILVNLVLFCDTTHAARTDAIEDCVDYSVIARQVYAYVQSAARSTVEALAADIAAICLENERVQSCRVRVEKPGAVRFTALVGVEIERARQ